MIAKDQEEFEKENRFIQVSNNSIFLKLFLESLNLELTTILDILVFVTITGRANWFTK